MDRYPDPKPAAELISILFFQVEKTCNSNPSELLLYPAREQSAPSPPLPPASSPAVVSDKPRQRSALTRSGSRSPQSPPSSSSSPSPPPPPAALSSELKVKLEELLEKYSSGLWAHALPKLFQDTYKVSVSQNAGIPFQPKL